MPKLLQINTRVKTGSIGRIADEIGSTVIKNGWESYIAFDRLNPHIPIDSDSLLIPITDALDIRWHGLHTRLFDRHGLQSKSPTRKLCSRIEDIKPDIIHLHNLHGYYLNYPILFRYLQGLDVPIVWTLHDCWSFTGHCPYFSFIKCDKWKSECYSCPQKRVYPATRLFDRSRSNFREKKYWFTSVSERLHIVTVSNWLRSQVEQSFFSGINVSTIYNGVDLKTFYPRNLSNKGNERFTILGVAGLWENRKGFEDFIALRKSLPTTYDIILIGLSDKQIKSLPEGIKGINRTENVSELAEYYSRADVYVNTSVEETLGMTSLEAQACGTPAIVYNATACPETVSANTGLVVNPGNIDELKAAIQTVESNGKEHYTNAALDWVDVNFNSVKQYSKYFALYEQLLNNRTALKG
jgi:glycosyltransferase involved in cell wall biosynthesis